MTDFFLIDAVSTRPCEVCGTPGIQRPATRCVECPAGTKRNWRRWRPVFALFGLSAASLASFVVLTRFPVPFEATFFALLSSALSFLAALLVGFRVSLKERASWYRAWYWDEMRRWRRARK